ncbi:hypothetical protein MES4922_30453 [Mesorhizobium ventifaucium]|uniref:Secreted protein n=1 Tax=Mesorhizobium ventifaucium TaxID=666020 RepID=A0ABM9DZ62_9HYPH|nr:hypothetical protein MES4922_30453 [Mesorhizobium ventifaucium]
MGSRRGGNRIVTVIAYKAFLYLILLLVLRVVEEVVVGLIHRRTATVALAESERSQALHDSTLSSALRLAPGQSNAAMKIV